MKEVTRNEALAGTWKELLPSRRLQLLKRLETNKDRFNIDTDIKEASSQDDWWKLPIPLRTFLDSAFDNGKFGITGQRKNFKRFSRLVRSIPA